MHLRELCTADRGSAAWSQHRLPNHDKCVFDSKIWEYGQIAIGLAHVVIFVLLIGMPRHTCPCALLINENFVVAAFVVRRNKPSNVCLFS